MIEIAFVVAGIIGLLVGAEVAINGAKKIAKALGISELLVGLTIISIGTSLPEIATSLMAGIRKAQGLETSGIAVGNIIGSEVANITIVLGICGLLLLLKTKRRMLMRDGIMLFGAFAAFFAVSIDGLISFGEGAMLVALYLAYLLYISKGERVTVPVEKEVFGRGKKKAKEEVGEGKKKEFVNPIHAMVAIIIGLVIVLFASYAIVDNGIVLARAFGVREFLIGLFIGFGTSLPELALALGALVKGSHAMSIGNIIGSNITNPLLPIGLGTVAAGMGSAGFLVENLTLKFDFPFWFLTTVLLFLFLWRGEDLDRIESVLLVSLYFVYMIVQVVLF